MMFTLLVCAAILQSDNALSAYEKSNGWELLFDGKSTNGWHSFRGKGVKSGWVIKDGALSIENPENAGDIVTDAKFKWFELAIDVKIEPEQNSGIMFHVSEDSEASWHSGPEIQIYDHVQEAGVETTGFLYQLYGSKFDASKPAGQWNTIRILVSPKMCATWVNGVKYYQYDMTSKEFWDLVAKSKFAKYPEFAKSGTGSIALQGDHGHVSFKNIKIKPIRTR